MSLYNTISLEDEIPTARERVARWPAGTHRTAERRVRIRTVLAHVAALTEPQRQALMLREVAGLTHREVAIELGISVGASKCLVHRAREALVRAAAQTA